MKDKIEWDRKWIMGLRDGTNNNLFLNNVPLYALYNLNQIHLKVLPLS